MSFTSGVLGGYWDSFLSSLLGIGRWNRLVLQRERRLHDVVLHHEIDDRLQVGQFVRHLFYLFIPPQASILPYLEVIFVIVATSIWFLWCVARLADVLHSVILVTSFCVAFVFCDIKVNRSPTPSRSVVPNLFFLSVVGHLFYFLSHRRC